LDELPGRDGKLLGVTPIDQPFPTNPERADVILDEGHFFEAAAEWIGDADEDGD